jgi:hypothetical protein
MELPASNFEPSWSISFRILVMAFWILPGSCRAAVTAPPKPPSEGFAGIFSSINSRSMKFFINCA